ncbi:hypothetical protein BJY24_004140 [Nocardia transvalensis]|uniref:Uncharacterized protein n=1 Tax=Nocardia transvalensis TaxID=37333 RepID=A0A7W9UJB4_9NOCA|nr:hypothetical protein [Nocardia transvalensis]MBB5915273.1 hypothetical protein [Nocardia transvalensis]
MPAQIVYTTVAAAGGGYRPRCTPIPVEAIGGVVALLAIRPPMPRVMFGAVAQFDECEEDDVPDGYVPVRVGGSRGRVIAAPMHRLRPVR